MIVRNETKDGGYHAARAREERALALHCRDQTAVLAHLRLAVEHDKRAETVSADGRK